MGEKGAQEIPIQQEGFSSFSSSTSQDNEEIAKLKEQLERENNRR